MVSNDLGRVIPQEIISCVMLVSTRLTVAQECLTLPMSRMIVELHPPCVGQTGYMRCIYTVSYTDGLVGCELLFWCGEVVVLFVSK